MTDDRSRVRRVRRSSWIPSATMVNDVTSSVDETSVDNDIDIDESGHGTPAEATGTNANSDTVRSPFSASPRTVSALVSA